MHRIVPIPALRPMDRRGFMRMAGAGAVGFGLGGLPLGRGIPSLGATGSIQEIEVDRERLRERLGYLATFGANDDGGIDRVAFSDANIEALQWLGDLLREAGLSTRTDVAGNLIGRKEGTDSTLAPILFGSHIDSVPGGGNFDGQVGSLGAVEVAATLADAGVRTRHPIEVVVFSNEEGGKTGSRALVGEVEAFELDIETASGYTIGEGLRRLGGDPDRLADARLEAGAIAAFLELHIEQGAVLDEDGIDIGVVEGIVGIMRWNVTVDGITNHAGSTPMDRRTDAMVGAARLIDAVHRIALETPGRQVATVGRIAAEPGAPNVIPGRVRMTLEIRDLSMEGIDRLFAAIRDEAARLTDSTGVEFDFERFYVSRAAPTSAAIRDVIESVATDLGLSSSRMPSGAGHDAQSMALVGPIGMIFVPSVAGVSHAPEEFTELNDIVNGSNVLLHTLRTLDANGVGRR